MSFMKPEVYTGLFYAIESNCGSEFFPAIGDTPESLGYPEDTEYEIRQGTIGRLSAPGYMDASDWSPYDSETEAHTELCEEAGICEHCESDLDDNGECDCDNESEA